MYKAQESMQPDIVQTYNGYEQPLNNKALDCSQKLFCCCKIRLGPTSRLQHNSCSASDGQSWNISHTTQAWRRSDFHLLPALKYHHSGHKLPGDDDMKTAVEVAENAGHRFIRGSTLQASPTTRQTSLSWWGLC